MCGRPSRLALPHYTIPSPTTRAHPAGMPGLETAGRGRGGRLSSWGVVERGREASLFHPLVVQWTAHVLGAD